VPGVGERIADRYELRTVLGEGGMAVVFRARDLRTQQDVALKFMRPPQRLLLRHVKRFWREARALSEVRHPHVIELIDFGVDEASGLPFMAMALVEGQALSELVLQAPLDERSAAKLLSAVARALEAAHARGFAHRDLKPDNVMLGADGRVVVLDFGVALALSDTDERITAPGAVVGTPHYMSPEQARGGGVDARSDLYGLGCILYATLTGAPPFAGDDPRRVMDLHLAMPPPPLPTRLVDGAPPTVALLSLAAALLAKDPEARPASAGAVGDVLEALSRGEAAAALRRLSESTAGVLARANARAAIAALPTGHAVPLEALVRPTPGDGRLGLDVGRPGTPLGRLPAADTAVAPREQDAPLDEPSVLRTAPTAWALERPGRDEPETPVDPVTHVALDEHAALGATRAALRSAVEARVVVGPAPSVDEPRRTEVRTAATSPEAPATSPHLHATLMRTTSSREVRVVADGVEPATRPSAGAVAVGVSRTFVAVAALSMLAVGIGVGWSMRSVGTPELEQAHDRPPPSPGATVSAPAAASGPAVVATTSSSGSLAGVTAAPQPAPEPVIVPSVSPSPSSAAVSPARPGGPRARPTERPSAAPSVAPTLGSSVVSVRLSSTPAGARVLRGAAALGVTPLDVRVEGEVSLRVVLDGYAERTVVLRAGDGERAVTLVPLF
jgi:serine/threonine-protein kinase